MIDLLLYSTIHCTDAEDMIRRVEANKNVDAIIRTEVIETVKEATPECNWDANDWRNGETDPPKGEKVNHPLQE